MHPIATTTPDISNQPPVQTLQAQVQAPAPGPTPGPAPGPGLQHLDSRLDPSHDLHSTHLDSTRLGSTRLSPTRFNSIRLNHISRLEALLLNCLHPGPSPPTEVSAPRPHL